VEGGGKEEVRGKQVFPIRCSPEAHTKKGGKAVRLALLPLCMIGEGGAKERDKVYSYFIAASVTDEGRGDRKGSSDPLSSTASPV